MMKRLCVAAGVVATISLLVCAGCNRTTDKTPESSPEFRQIKTSLDASQKLNEQLEPGRAETQQLSEGGRIQAGRDDESQERASKGRCRS